MSCLDTAWASSNRVMKSIDTMGHERILFGSDIHLVKTKNKTMIVCDNAAHLAEQDQALANGSGSGYKP
jgi:hypothetical protein